MVIKQFRIAAIHLRRRHTEGELYACRVGRFLSIVGTPTLAQCEQDSPNPHFDPILPVPINGKAQRLMIKRLHARRISAQEHHIIKIANMTQQHLTLLESNEFAGRRFWIPDQEDYEEIEINSIRCLSMSCHGSVRSILSIRMT